jgi:hypothetical protein
MTAFDQNFNRFLAVENTVLAVCGQKLSVVISENQRLNSFSFSYTKKELSTPTPTRPHSAGEVAGWVTTHHPRSNRSP